MVLSEDAERRDLARLFSATAHIHCRCDTVQLVSLIKSVGDFQTGFGSLLLVWYSVVGDVDDEMILTVWRRGVSDVGP